MVADPESKAPPLLISLAAQRCSSYKPNGVVFHSKVALGAECLEVKAEDVSPQELQEIAGLCADNVSHNAYWQTLMVTPTKPAKTEVILTEIQNVIDDHRIELVWARPFAHRIYRTALA